MTGSPITSSYHDRAGQARLNSHMLFRMMRRRTFLGALTSASLARLAAAQVSSTPSTMRLSMPPFGLTDSGLNFVKQLGVQWIAMGGPGAPTYSPEGRVVAQAKDSAPTTGPWTEAQIRQIKDRVESFGLRIGIMMLHDFRDVILGRSGRDAAIENVQQSIRVAGRVGIPTVEYNFYALRAMGGYGKKEGRGGSIYASHDADRNKELKPLPDVGEHSETDLWSRYTYFLKAIIPVAEQAGVKMAVHPNDPPVPVFRGTAQILGSIDGLKRLVDIVPSPANGITLDTGVTREMGFDPIEMIRYFGKRKQINHIHFRNVITEVPRLKYTEVYLDEGQVDMLAALKALAEVGYSNMIYPDHVPGIPGDEGSRIGWAYAVGHIKALMRAANIAM
jgi:mannonate dehydratase